MIFCDKNLQMDIGDIEFTELCFAFDFEIILLQRKPQKAFK